VQAGRPVPHVGQPHRGLAVDQHGQLGQVSYVGREKALRPARPELTVPVGQDHAGRGHGGGELVDEESAHLMDPILELLRA
jgi:hypothetical protein